MNKDKVRELVNSVLTATVLRKQSVEIEHIIKEWLEQNQPETIVVGLSDEQIKELCNLLTNKHNFTWYLEVKEWQKTRTFSPPEEFKINWEHAPKDAVKCVISYEFQTESTKSLGHRNVIRIERKPKVQVEVGQVWKGEGIKVKVGCLGRVSKNGEESIAFVDVDTNELKIWLLKTFLAKFELTIGE
jgi:hypothetical protein